MTSVNEVYNLLKSSSAVTKLISPDNIGTFNLPDFLVNKTNENVMLITEVSNQFSGFASDRSHFRRPLVQLQTWFAENADIDQFQNMINDVMESNNWYSYSDVGIDTDPDTKQLYWTIEYIRTERK